MILYEVVLQVDPQLGTQVEEHMRRDHIPQIFATGCFQSIHFERSATAQCRTSYEAMTQADLDRYLRDHAPRLRVEFQAAFPTGVTITRATWMILERWG
jgi:hypothetical protein